ncbi:MAG: dienelactone hydrolase family protein [Candidatus Aminicenantes bacterium]|nr:dienelactone hydrolase family protein [Candidatus Aminicenantes bacterium]
MDKKFIDLYQDYSKGHLGRREFLKKLAALAGSTAAGVALLPLIEKKYAQAQFVPEDEPRLQTGYIQYPGQTGEVRAYKAQPKENKKHAGVIVIHENKGLQPHIEDVARRVALEGYCAIAPDALSPLGGTPESVDDARSKMRELDREDTVKNFVAAVQYLKTHPQTTGKVGCMGFCWGGSMTNQVAVHAPDLTAAVPFYGGQPDPEQVPQIKASLLLQYAGLDDRINAGIPEFEKALKKAGVEYEMFMYEGAGHAFFNDSRAERYHEKAAQLAWKRTLAFFKEKLKT